MSSRTRRRVFLGVLAGAYLGLPARAQDGPFDDCGTLIQGVECLLFQADSGGTYVLGDTGGFVAGQRVRVSGERTSGCVTACMQGNGCIVNNSIRSCDDALALCGTVWSLNQCAVLLGDDGNLYALDNYGGFSPGQRVHVVGELQASCGGECAQGLSCIRNNSIHDASQYCAGPTLTLPGVVNPGGLSLCSGTGLMALSLGLAGMALCAMHPRRRLVDRMTRGHRR